MELKCIISFHFNISYLKYNTSWTMMWFTLLTAISFKHKLSTREMLKRKSYYNI